MFYIYFGIMSMVLFDAPWWVGMIFVGIGIMLLAGEECSDEEGV